MIQNFIENNIVVDRFPVSKEIREGKHKDCQVIINVSDEFYLLNSQDIAEQGKMNYYFPMGESGENMGLNSIYGALHVLHQVFYHNPEWKVLLHCQAGANRSPTVKAAFHYTMLGEHVKEVKQNGIFLSSNQLIWNCEKGHLPPLETMELFLTKCRTAFDNPDKFFGGMFDWVMKESGLTIK